VSSSDVTVGTAPVRLSGCTVDPVRRVVERDDGRRVKLTAQEAGAFVYLAARANSNVAREDLLEHVWGYKRDLVTRAVDNAIARLRAKIEVDTRSPEHLLTVRGKGYCLVLDAPAAPLDNAITPDPEFDPARLSPLRSSMGGVVAPEGKVAIATAVVDGAETLWQATPTAMAEASEACDRILRECLAEVGGYEVRSDTSGFMVAFLAAAEAVQWSAAVQLAMANHAWPEEMAQPDAQRPEGGLMVCVGVDLGEPLFRRDPVTSRMEYFGPMVNRAGQLAHLARGGEVLATAALAEVVGSSGPISWSAIGAHELVPGSGIITRLVQLRHADMVTRSLPPLGEVGVQQTNLQSASSVFIGRTENLATLDEQVRSGSRWITISGPAGVGKSRLVQEAGLAWAADFSGGVWSCDAAACHGVADLIGTIARTIGLTIHSGVSSDGPRTQMGQALAGRGQMVLLLDNFEALIDSCADVVSEWLERAPQLQLVITSRVRCQTDAEQVLSIEPLPLEDAVRLFEARARRAKRGFVLDTKTRPIVEAIVRALDRIPLAIELAAARVRMLAPSQLLERLSDRFTLLRSATKRDRSRHSTLWDAIDWSWQLLNPAERFTLAQCCVFDGGFDLEAAESVIGLPDSSDGAEFTVLDTIESLRDQSLLLLLESPLAPGRPRFGLLGSVRAYAAAHLDDLDPKGVAIERHRAYFTHLMHPLQEDLGQAGAEENLTHLELELPNLYAAFGHSVVSDPESAAVLAVGMRQVFILRGPRHRTTELIDQIPLDAVSLPRRAVCLTMRAADHQDRSDWTSAAADLTQALAAADAAGLPEPRAHVRMHLGDLARRQGDTKTAETHLSAALELARSEGIWQTEVRALRRLGILAVQHDDTETAEARFMEAIAGADANDATLLSAVIGSSLGLLKLDAGDFDAADTRFHTLQSVADAAGDELNAAVALANLGMLSLARGQHDEALDQLQAARDRVVVLGHQRVLAEIDAGIERVKSAGSATSDTC